VIFRRIFLSQGSSDAYWIATLAEASAYEFSMGVAADASKNVYWSFYISPLSGSEDIILAKLGPTGSVTWQRRLAKSAANSSPANPVILANGNIASGGFVDVAAYNFVYDNTGALQWQRTLTPASNAARTFWAATDASSNLFTAGYSNNAANLFVAKYNSSGTIQAQFSINTGASSQGESIAVDSSANLFVSGQGFSSPTFFYAAKLNSAGTVQWDRKIAIAPYTSVCAPSGNIYFLANPSSVATIIKLDSSGSIAWQKTLTGDFFFRHAAEDSSGNVYVAAATSTDAAIVKYNSSGTVQWIRTLAKSSTDYSYGDRVAVSGNAVYLAGSYVPTGTEENVFLAKLPTDGSLTGTYGTWTYASTTGTTGTPSYSTTTPGLTSSTTSLTDAAGSSTSSTSTLTSAVTSL
jgi:hypothetical protein